MPESRISRIHHFWTDSRILQNPATPESRIHNWFQNPPESSYPRIQNPQVVSESTRILLPQNPESTSGFRIHKNPYEQNPPESSTFKSDFRIHQNPAESTRIPRCQNPESLTDFLWKLGAPVLAPSLHLRVSWTTCPGTRSFRDKLFLKLISELFYATTNVKQTMKLRMFWNVYLKLWKSPPIQLNC